MGKLNNSWLKVRACKAVLNGKCHRYEAYKVEVTGDMVDEGAGEWVTVTSGKVYINQTLQEDLNEKDL